MAWFADWTRAGRRGRLLLFALLLLLPGCNFAIPLGPPVQEVGEAQTPAEAARRATNVQEFRMLGQRNVEGDVLVFYRFTEDSAVGQPQPLPQSFGYAVTVRQGAGWLVRAAGGTSGGPVSQEGLAELGVIRLPARNDPDQAYTAILGEVVQPGTTVVEARLATGDTLRESVEAGAFVLIVPQVDVAACALRLLDADEALLEEIPISDC